MIHSAVLERERRMGMAAVQRPVDRFAGSTSIISIWIETLIESDKAPRA